MAIASSAIEIRSPAVSNMSNSRPSGTGTICFARSISSSVVSPIAETTTATSCPARLVATMRSATRLIRSASATEEPPYFWTTKDMRQPLGLAGGVLRIPGGADLIGAAAGEHGRGGAGEDREIELHAPVLDVVDVELDPLVVADVVAARHLPQPGDAGLEREEADPLRAVALKCLGRDRPRADQAELAGQHVVQLRHLVEAGTPQEPAEPGD